MKNLKSALLIVFFLLFLVKNLSAQASISGAITDFQNNPLSGITILIQGTKIGVASDLEGNYKLDNLPLDTYTLDVTGVGFKKQTKVISLSTNQNLVLNIVLEEDTTQIDEVIVTGKRKTTRVEEKGLAVNSIATQPFQNNTTDVNQILNQTSGVRIKESGGLGSNYELSLNGLSGRQIRIFVDDIPVDQLGSSFNLNNLAVNLVERIDVYKGVVPIHLGADALGGAVNIITDKKANSFLDASYSVGSFNTHRATLNGKYRFENSGFTVKATGFYNYSENNYQMNNQTVFIDGVEQEVDIERFHDTYKSAMGNVGLGFTNVSWADALMADVSVADIAQDVQSGIFGTPVGEAVETEKNTTYSLRYSKSGLFNGKLSTNLFALYNEITSQSIDTSSNRYDWSGRIIRTENNNLGELVREKTIFEYEQSQLLYRLNAVYAIADDHRISTNHIYSNIERQGENRLNTSDNEPFRSPNTLKSAVTGVSYESNFFDDRLENNVFLKYFDFDLLTRNAVEFQQNQFEIEDIETTQQNIGYGVSSRFFIKPNWLIKASYEKGFRIPQPTEIFGDGLLIIANSALAPESSHNINLGTNFSTPVGNGTLKNEVNVFQRDVDNFIRIRQDGRFSTYENIVNVLVLGVEWDALYHWEKFIFNGNLTWQNVLNNQEFITGTTTPSEVFHDRMPNTPYFFANANINYDFGVVFSNIRMNAYYEINYVHSYFLNYPSTSIASTKNSIPDQFLNHLGATFSTADNRYNVSLEMRNLFNAEAFDNFNLQKPGRAVYLKLRYFIQ